MSAHETPSSDDPPLHEQVDTLLSESSVGEPAPQEHAAERQNPLAFDGGAVKIAYLAGSQSGFTVESVGTLGRTEGFAEPLALSNDQRESLSVAYQGIARHNAVLGSKAAKEKWQKAVQTGAPAEEVATLKAEFDAATAHRRSAPLKGERRFNSGDLLDYARDEMRDMTGAMRARDELNAARQSGADSQTIAGLEAQLNAATAAWSSTIAEGEANFRDATFVDDARTTLEGFRNGEEITREKLDSYQDSLAKIRAAYRERGKKVGIRNVTVHGDRVLLNTKSVPFPVYTELAKPGNSPEVLDISGNVGAAMILRTKPTEDDPTGQLIIQHRAVAVQRLHEPKMTPGNRSYTDIPGASVAGVVDATYGNMTAAQREVRDLRSALREAELRNTDKAEIAEIQDKIESLEQNYGPDPVNENTILSLITKEAGEELGVGPEHLSNVIVAGIGPDPVKPHDEFFLLGETNLTAAEINEVSQKSNRNKNLGAADFEEKYFDIPATPQAVETLLTQVHCPLPPTHASALIAAGYSLELRANGIDAAEAWRRRLETGVRKNYEAINKTVEVFYGHYPEALSQVPERFWGGRAPERNRHGYDPSYTPSEQGLPELENEMVRVGLSTETRIKAPVAELYDVDGVLTDAFTKQPSVEALQNLAEKIRSGMPIGLNTGRSTEWVRQQVLPILEEAVGDRRLMQNLVIIGEKAGTWTYFDSNGNMLDGRNAALTVPSELQERVDALVEEKYSQLMGNLDPKTTMTSIEMKNDVSKEDFKAAQHLLAADLRNLLKELGLGHLYEVDETTIATDIQSPFVGKDTGMDRFIQWLKDRNITVGHINTAGDSASDAAMARAAQRRGISVTHFYVGEKEKPSGANLVGDVVATDELYGKTFAEGTVYLMRTGAL